MMSKAKGQYKILIGTLSYKKGDDPYTSVILPFNSHGDQVNHTAIAIETGSSVIFTAASSNPINKVGTGGTAMENIKICESSKDGILFMNKPIIGSKKDFYSHYSFNEGKITGGLLTNTKDLKLRVGIIRQLFYGMNEGIQSGALWELKSNWFGKSLVYKESMTSLLNDEEGETASKICSAIIAENHEISFENLEQSFITAQKTISLLSVAEDSEIIKFFDSNDHITYISFDKKGI